MKKILFIVKKSFSRKDTIKKIDEEILGYEKGLFFMTIGLVSLGSIGLYFSSYFSLQKRANYSFVLDNL
jgi:hypothetical protein